MQRYLHSLIKKNENINESMSVNAFETEKNEESGSVDRSTPAVSTMTKCDDVEGSNEPSNKKLKSVHGDDASGSASDRASLESSAAGTKSGGGSKSSSVGKKKRSKPNDGKGDNFKNVDVLHNSVLLARFQTQTECAAYLRATPEAVSYHCSKGGGICNGLLIQPSKISSVPLVYGLFDGAEENRPKVRPQLNKESVKILKDWLLSPEHVKNPYPNQLEMNSLVQKTGLDKTQLKHWFNNARKRILKPYLQDSGHTASGKGKKSRIRNGSAADADAISTALKTAAAAVKPKSESAAEHEDDGPTLTEIDDMPRLPPVGGNQSLFGNADVRGPNSAVDMALRDNVLGNHLRRDSLFGHTPSGLAGVEIGLSMMGPNRFGASHLDAFGRLDHRAAGLGMPLGRGTNGDSLFCIDQEDLDPSPDSTRSNAVFKQQVAAMAMDEANNAFQDTEAAYARAKEFYARSTYARPEEEDPLVIEANSVAKRCQSVAVFKLKVSQRANEEAAKAYSKCQQLGGGMGLNNFNGSSGL
jgi:hypothetical protein